MVDADAVFPKNPFEFYKQKPELDLELCSDAPYLANNYENEPMMVMAGYFYARGGARTARFLEEVLDYQEPFQPHFNPISAPFQPHSNAISARFQPHFNAIPMPFQRDLTLFNAI